MMLAAARRGRDLLQQRQSLRQAVLLAVKQRRGMEAVRGGAGRRRIDDLESLSGVSLPREEAGKVETGPRIAGVGGDRLLVLRSGTGGIARDSSAWPSLRNASERPRPGLTGGPAGPATARFAAESTAARSCPDRKPGAGAPACRPPPDAPAPPRRSEISRSIGYRAGGPRGRRRATSSPASTTSRPRHRPPDRRHNCARERMPRARVSAW